MNQKQRKAKLKRAQAHQAKSKEANKKICSPKDLESEIQPLKSDAQKIKYEIDSLKCEVNTLKSEVERVNLAEKVYMGHQDSVVLPNSPVQVEQVKHIATNGVDVVATAQGSKFGAWHKIGFLVLILILAYIGVLVATV